MSRLIDGSAPARPVDLFTRLDALGIEHHTVEHPPVFTVEEAKRWRGDLPGGHIKNLFLRDKQKRMWLITCLEDRAIDLDELAGALGAKRLSFASAERLMLYLGVIHGAVTPFALMNDRTLAVSSVLDQGLLGFERLNVHPLDNARTTIVSPAGLLRFLHAVEHPPELFDFTRMARVAPD